MNGLNKTESAVFLYCRLYLCLKDPGFFSDDVNDIRRLTLKAPITTAADGKFCHIFSNFQNT